MKFIALDSTPLGLLTQRPGATEADACRKWLAAKAAIGVRAVVPEIIDYEVQRELIRAGKPASIQRLDEFAADPSIVFLPLTTPAIRLAAELWAKVRQQGRPTTHEHALDVDVILAAQILTSGFPPGEFVVATANVGHLSRFVPADLWQNI